MMKSTAASLVRVLGLGLILSLSNACSSVPINEIPVTEQHFLVEEYFQGATHANGIVFDRSGTPMRYFTVDLDGVWDETSQTLTLTEDFSFDDGERSQRIWRIAKNAVGKYTGLADDVKGQAIGTSRGNVLNWQYTLNIPYKNKTLSVQLNDWMYLQGGVLLNRAVMRKFGFRVGEIFISFDRLS